MKFDESIEVERNIICKDTRFNLKVAWNIVARNIVAGNIVAGNIDARNIVAWNIIYCETVTIKDKSKGKIKAKVVIRKRSELEQKEFESD